MVPGNRVGDISSAVQTHVEQAGFSIIRSLVGHGIGREMHEQPQIPNYGTPGRGPEIKSGMVFAIEPMVNVGGPEVYMADDGWSVYSEDDSMAAHFEYTVAATDKGPRVLNPWDGS
jgi:methionyl aminopeptidase